MWRRTYLLLLLIRVYFALSPSYLHPDENFQGPELFAGRIFSFPSKLPWEFTVEHPIRSIFPLWATYELPMTLLKWFYTEIEEGTAPPHLVYYALRGGMFLLSFVLEDWAIYELVPSPRHRRATVVLVASSYVTWTYQTHTFSNSLETLLVAWGLVLIRRIVENKRHSHFFSHAVLAFIAVLGVFNRITFPAFLLFPGLQLLPQFLRKPASLVTFLFFGLFFSFVAVYTDTTFYRPTASLCDTLRNPIITPLNNLLYNSDTSNLAQHGLHPHHQHFTANLFQLLGPAYIVMLVSLFNWSLVPLWMRNVRALSALSATMLLSLFPHQEPRFLLPAVPLLLSCVPLRRSRFLLGVWVIFNAAMGFLMGIYHQGGVVPTQLAMRDIVSASTTHHLPSATVFWWKTYSPPLWLLGGHNQSTDIQTVDLMGIPGVDMVQQLEQIVPDCLNPSSVFLVAPISADFLDQYSVTTSQSQDQNLRLHPVWSYRQHLNLDDMDFGDDGIIPTLKRVVGRRGLGVWSVRRPCK
ncbi:CAZyme family GT22 [Penicillium paradoxum]|uniref:CAZyme family GT22 n=1 Tax=Penicillium paradoxum TaxID=176176 RepID=UPI002548DCEA|nr:CAZyme family GT22 [Penicillium paradoxum]KAJ5787044.1 CAZyme family GT22 [Penicillium paradoxum]